MSFRDNLDSLVVQLYATGCGGDYASIYKTTRYIHICCNVSTAVADIPGIACTLPVVVAALVVVIMSVV